MTDQATVELVLAQHSSYTLKDPTPTEHWWLCACGERFPVQAVTTGALYGHRAHIAAKILDALQPTEQPARPPVHNHPPYEPPCPERRTNAGHLRGACLDDAPDDAPPPWQPGDRVELIPMELDGQSGYLVLPEQQAPTNATCACPIGQPTPSMRDRGFKPWTNHTPDCVTRLVVTYQVEP